jgi:hypothetical protein
LFFAGFISRLEEPVRFSDALAEAVNAMIDSKGVAALRDALHSI